LPDPSLTLGLVPFLAGPSLELVDSGLEVLLSGQALPKGDVEAIPVAAECLQLVSQPGQPKPIRFSVLEFGAEPIPLGADNPQFPFLRGRLVPQLVDLGPQPAVLRAEFVPLRPQSLCLLELFLDSLELLLKLVQPALSPGELILQLGDLLAGGFTLGHLVGQRGADPMELTLPLRFARWVRDGRSRRVCFPAGYWPRWSAGSRIVARSGAELLAAILAVDLVTEVLGADPQVAPMAMGAGDQEMSARALAILRRLDHRSYLGCGDPRV
jgi:hypothetical protein